MSMFHGQRDEPVFVTCYTCGQRMPAEKLPKHIDTKHSGVKRTGDRARGR
jgi:hypothetical protein